MGSDGRAVVLYPLPHPATWALPWNWRDRVRKYSQLRPSPRPSPKEPAAGGCLQTALLAGDPHSDLLACCVGLLQSLSRRCGGCSRCHQWRACVCWGQGERRRSRILTSIFYVFDVEAFMPSTGLGWRQRSGSHWRRGLKSQVSK